MLNCPLCAGADLNEVFHVPQSPVSIGLLRDTCLDEIESVEIALVQCLHCGHVFNACFDVAKISEAYVSDRYVVKRNVSANMNNVEGKIFGELETFLRPCSVWLEIGSGSGALANHVAPRVARIVTIDPSPCSAPVFCPTNRIHIQDFFSKGYFPSNEFSGIVFRHLLEHIADPNGFIVSVADILETGGYVYVEVPNFTEIHSSGRFLDIFHDHFSYFSEDGLVRLFEANGFQAVRRLAFYDDQHQGIIFRKGQNQARVDCTSEKLFHGDRFWDSFETFSVLLSSMASRDNLVVWGAGAHGNNLSSHVKSILGLQDIKSFTIALDADSSKQGKYLSSLPAKVLHPQSTDLSQVKGIVIASTLHEIEIMEYIRSHAFKGEVLLTAKQIELVRI